MLWFIAVEAIPRNVHQSDHQHQSEKNCGGDELAGAGHFEILSAALRKRCSSYDYGFRFAHWHVAMKPDLG
jgi:hypothetical protein